MQASAELCMPSSHLHLHKSTKVKKRRKAQEMEYPKMQSPPLSPPLTPPPKKVFKILNSQLPLPRTHPPRLPPPLLERGDEQPMRPRPLLPHLRARALPRLRDRAEVHHVALRPQLLEALAQPVARLLRGPVVAVLLAVLEPVDGRPGAVRFQREVQGLQGFASVFAFAFSGLGLLGLLVGVGVGVGVGGWWRG